MTLKLKVTLVCVSLALLLPVRPVCAEDSDTPEAAPRLSFNAMDLCGKWSLRGDGRYDTRTFEFFPDGRVTEENTYRSSRGETTETYEKLWKIQGDQVLIWKKGEGESSGQSIFIEIPFDAANLQISEVWKSPSSTRVTKMVFNRTEAAKPDSRSAVANPAADQLPPSALLSELGIAVSPSAKKSTEGYYKIERLSLNITLKNPSMRESTGPMTVSYWIFGKNISDSKQFCVLSKGKFDCALGNTATDRTIKRTTETYLNKYWDYSSSGSFEYAGWIVTVSDPAGRVALIKASKSEWERQGDKLPALDVGKVYDLRLDKVDGAHVPRYM